MFNLRKDRYTVLIADSNSYYLKILKQYIDKIEWLDLVDFAFNGIEVINKAFELMPDLIIMDLILPYKDALGVLEILSVDKRMDHTRIIVNSAVNRDSVVSKIFDLGADYIFMKPVDFDTFNNRIADLFAENASMPSKLTYSKQETKTPENMYNIVSRMIQGLGMPVHIKGYNYIRHAIMLAMEDPDILNSVTKKLYPSIANKFESSPSRVERNIRHAIEVTWTKGDMRAIDLLFGYTVDANKGKPTNSAFIATIIDKLSIDMLRVD